MSTPLDKHATAFTTLCPEIRLRIWEVAIGSPSVRRIYASITPGHPISPTPDLVRSTATARAGLAVSRADRDLIRRWIVPDEIPFACGCDGPCPLRQGVLRYNAARDIVCFANMLPVDSSLKTALPWSFYGFYRLEKSIGAWAHGIQKVAIELDRSILVDLDWEPSAQASVCMCLTYFCILFLRLQRLYAVYEPADGWLNQDAADEESEPQEAAPREMTADSVGALIPWCDEGETDAGHYADTCNGDAYFSGMAALEWLKSRRGNAALVQEVTQLSRWRDKLRQQCRGLADKGSWGLTRDEQDCLSGVSVRYLLHLRQT
ncbi:hypothetical protein Trco_002394 [Trichoderma cornu-damae]|uniref:Uncharacterized protein n=1 Tax=Trichoderma cornu-damae TaxID=654480 RepID=A0A9P8QTK9_9HYPO|nr:hypothetical protein Trco_002394 [Trichoderma cornu-damae]